MNLHVCTDFEVRQVVRGNRSAAIATFTYEGNAIKCVRKLRRKFPWVKFVVERVDHHRIE